MFFDIQVMFFDTRINRRSNNKFVIRHSSFVIPRRGLTLIEMLIGMAITLVMMAAVVNLFANIGAGIRVQRAAMEMSSQLRTTRARLFMDLAGATCAARPKLPTDDHDDGYLEIIEGEYSDKNPSLLVTGGGIVGVNRLDPALSQVPRNNNATDYDVDGDIDDLDMQEHFNQPQSLAPGGLGDYDDILALTVRSETDKFVGRGLVFDTSTNSWQDRSIQSEFAEVIWFAVENPADGSLGEPGMRTVYRRVLLIAPWVDPIDPTTLAVTFNDPTDPSEFFRRFDISARYDATIMRWIPNTLADLVKRENRFGHFYDGTTLNGFPHAFWQAPIIPNAASPAFPANPISLSPLHPFGLPFEWDPTDPTPANPTIPPTPNRLGEDIMLNDVLAFDVRVYDPGAPLRESTGIILEPSDWGWAAAPIVAVGYGTYVDMGWDPTAAYPRPPLPPNTPAPLFDWLHQAGWHPNFPALFTSYPATYDTWSYHYENDGIPQDGLYGIDQGTNGLDDDGINGTDDVGERETSPPYDVPLRGIQVKLRVYEPDTRQIREATITRGLVPQ